MPIVEYPAIRIDDFTQRTDGPPSDLCFLTHMHEDHTHGLARKSYYGPHVYCTAATRALLLNFRTNSGAGELKYNHLRREVCGKEIVKTLDLNRQYELPYLSTSVLVTLIDANHCPGAAMVLIQPKYGEGLSVLFTGDLRCEKWHVDALVHNPAVYPFLSAQSVQSRGTRKNGKSGKPTKKYPQKIALYVDNTFESHANPFKSYHENKVGIQGLLDLMDSYPHEVHFCLADRVSGYEEVLIAVAHHLDTLIHMDSYQYNLYMLAADSSPLAAKILQLSTLDLQGSKPVRLHYCQKNTACPFRDPSAPTAYFKPCNQPSQELVDRQNDQYRRLRVPPGVLVPMDDDKKVFKGPDQRYFLDTPSDKYFPLFPWFFFSRHASFPEIRDFCSLFNACAVRSLEGVPLGISLDQHLPPCDEHAVNSINSRDTDRTVDSVSKKRKIIPVHHDRLRIQHARDKQRHRYRQKHDGESDISSTYDSSDEEQNHQAMMELGRQRSKQLERAKWHKSFVEGERKLRESIGRNATDENGDVTPVKCKNPDLLIVSMDKSPPRSRMGTIGVDTVGADTEVCRIELRNSNSLTGSSSTVMMKEPESIQGKVSPQEKSLPSPSPLDDSSFKFIDETPTEQALSDTYVELLRSNPHAWFDFSFDCLSGST